MKKFGWGRASVVLGLTLAATALPANAGGYILSMAGNGSTFPDLSAGPNWGVQPGGTFQVDAVLTDRGLGPPTPAAVHDSAIFNVNFTGPRSLLYNRYLWHVVAYQTGSVDDFSIPKGALDTGILPVETPIVNGTYAPTPAVADVHFEAITRGGQTFGVGTLVTLTLKAPDNATPGELYTIGPAADEFALLGNVVPVLNGSSLGVVIVPEPATLVLFGLGGLAAFRRRLLGA